MRVHGRESVLSRGGATGAFAGQVRRGRDDTSADRALREEGCRSRGMAGRSRGWAANLARVAANRAGGWPTARVAGRSRGWLADQAAANRTLGRGVRRQWKTACALRRQTSSEDSRGDCRWKVEWAMSVIPSTGRAHARHMDGCVVATGSGLEHRPLSGFHACAPQAPHDGRKPRRVRRRGSCIRLRRARRFVATSTSFRDRDSAPCSSSVQERPGADAGPAWPARVSGPFRQT